MRTATDHKKNDSPAHTPKDTGTQNHVTTTKGGKKGCPYVLRTVQASVVDEDQKGGRKKKDKNT